MSQEQHPVTIVTAAGQGMGEAIARRLHSDGHHLVLMSNSGGAETLAAELGQVGLTGSVADPDHLKRLVDQTMSEFGKIDGRELDGRRPGLQPGETKDRIKGRRDAVDLDQSRSDLLPYTGRNLGGHRLGFEVHS